MMMPTNPRAVFIVVSLLLLNVTYGQQCPPTGYNAVNALDLDQFVGDRWYSIRQLTINVQPQDQSYCVYAKYDILKTPYTLICRIFGCTDPASIAVVNSARVDSTTGRPVSVNFRAIIPDIANEPAKANVGPQFIPNFVRGSRTNYWVIVVGKYNELPTLTTEPDSERYQWAVITSGAINLVGTTNATKCYSASGMWFFARDPNPPAGYDEALTTIATSFGIETENLLPVNHTGCDYENQRAGFISTIFTLLTGLF